ncbi:hypothetical protein ACS0TY_010708 [Phlomoides rotata]
MHAIVPSNQNLISRFVNVPPECARCNDDLESFEHVIRDCPALDECWTELPFQLRFRQDGLELGEWILAEMRHLSKEESGLFVALLWAAWFARNEAVFHGKVLTGGQVREIAFRHVADYKNAMVRISPVNRDSEAGKWLPPQNGFIKLNVDAAYRRGIGVGLGGVLRDNSGRIIWAWARREGFVFSVELTEAMAVREGVRMTVGKGIQRIIIEMDSQIVCT